MAADSDKGKISADEIAESIRASTLEVFSTMLGIDVKAGEAIHGKCAFSQKSGIIALLGLAGDWVGAGRISCNPVFGCKIASALLMGDYGGVNEEVLDAVGEIANMIVGNVKTALEARLGPLGLSTPTVLYGVNLEARSVGSQDAVTVVFASEHGHLEVQISIAPRRAERDGRTHGLAGKTASGRLDLAYL
jgi:chemotaxis protein CheX